MGDFDDGREMGLWGDDGIPYWMDDDVKDDKYIKNDYDSSTSIPKYQNIKATDNSIDINLTPSKYLSSEEQNLRNRLINNELNSSQINLKVIHNPKNTHDSLALEVYNNNVKIGHIQKYDNPIDINQFCFINNKKVDNLKIEWIDNKFKLLKDIVTNKKVVHQAKPIKIESKDVEPIEPKKQEPKNLNEYLWNGLNTEKFIPSLNEEFGKFKNRVISSFKKDEFETTEEFEKRIKESESEILNNHLGKQDITMKYNADNSSFLVMINEGLIFQISVPRDIAPEFKSSVKSFAVRCSKDLRIIDISTEFKGIKYIGNDFKDNWILSKDKKRMEKIKKDGRETFLIFFAMLSTGFFLSYFFK